MERGKKKEVNTSLSSYLRNVTAYQPIKYGRGAKKLQ
jgi:hypothetical protein